jgi:platelet-activating factor acetylhydrolase IB subunit alpha
MKTIEAHGHFINSLAWGRQVVSAGGKKDGKVNGTDEVEPDKVVNVVASASIDQTIKVWLP